MGILVDIMGLSVNIMTDKELLGLMKLYLGNDYMNIIYMFSVDTCSKIAGNEELTRIMDDADLRLPAEKIMLNKKYRHMHKGISNSYMSFLYMLRCKGLVKSMYVIGKTAKQTSKLVEVLSAQNEEINICGTYSLDSDENTETIVNEINSFAPEIIVLAIDTPDVQNWIKSNRQMLNSKLCVALCDIAEMIVIENAEPANWLKKIYFRSIVKMFLAKKYTENKKKERIFQTLLAEYNEKKE